MNRRGVFYPFLAIYAYQQLSANLVHVGLLSALPMVASSLTQPFWGRISDRARKRRLFIVFGETVAGIAYLLMMHVREVWYLIIGLTILEGFWSISNVAWSALIIDMTRSSERGRVMGSLNTIGVAGMSFGVFLAGITYDVTGFAINFVISSVMMFVSAGIVLVLIDESGAVNRLCVEAESEPEGGKGNIWMLKVLVLTSSLSMFGVNALRQLMMIYMSSGFSLTGTLIGAISAVGSLVNLVLGIPLGYFSDRVDKKNLYVVALVLNVAIPFMLFYSESPFQFAIVSVWMGMSWPLSEITAFPLAAEFAPTRERGKFLGYFNSVRFLMGFGLPPLILGGYLADYLKNSYLMQGLSEKQALLTSSRETFLVAMLVSLVGALLWILSVKKRE